MDECEEEVKASGNAGAKAGDTEEKRYFGEETHEDTGIGQSIMIESFRTIERELADPDIPLGRKWPLLHAIHTTADFDMENIVKVDDGAVANIYEALSSGSVRTIITDVTMSASGIRKGALERLGVEVKCYLSERSVFPGRKIFQKGCIDQAENGGLAYAVDGI